MNETYPLSTFPLGTYPVATYPVGTYPRNVSESNFPAMQAFTFSQVDERDYQYDLVQADIPDDTVLNIQVSDDGISYFDFTWYVNTDPDNSPYTQSHYDPAGPGFPFTDFDVGNTYYMRVRYQDAEPGSETEVGEWTVLSFVAV